MPSPLPISIETLLSKVATAKSSCIPVEVARRYTSRIPTEVVLDRALEGCVAVAQEDRDTKARFVGRRKIELAVRVEVACDYGVRRANCGNALTFRECPIAIAKENSDVTASPCSDGQVHNSVFVKVTR